MLLDGFFFNALVAEIQESLQGSRVEDFYENLEGNLVLQVRTPGKTLRLEISLLAQVFYWREGLFPRNNASAFSQTVKKHLQGLFCLAFTTPPFDRQGDLFFGPAPAAPSSHSLHLELMGRQRDLVLCAGDIIIASTRPPRPGPHRQLQPGERYLPPPRPPQVAPTDLTDSVLTQLFAGLGELPCEKALTRTVFGLGPLLARDICTGAGVIGLPAADVTATAISRLTAEIARFCRLNLQGERQALLYPLGPYWTQLSHLASEAKPAASLSAAIIDWLTHQAAADKFSSLARNLQKVIDTHSAKVQGALAKQELELARADNFDAPREIGDTLLANLHGIPKGVKAVTLENVHRGQPVLISLEPGLTASANAARYYKKYNKYKNAAAKVRKQIQLKQEQLAYLQSLQYALTAADTLADLRQVEEEMAETRLISVRCRTPKTPPSDPTCLRYTTPAGVQILVGKNNRQNERLTLHLANKDFFWLHCRYSPGSHIILCTSAPAESDLSYAAGIAAWHSKERSAPRVEVVYTQVKNVKKIPGGKPGLVKYENYQSISIAPIPC